MRVHLLHWLEVLGLIGRMTEAVESLALLGTLYVCPPHQCKLMVAQMYWPTNFDTGA
jgi:hypothetical protein